MGLYCGIDLHSNNHVLTVIDEARSAAAAHKPDDRTGDHQGGT
jgi:hypothetical protein